MELIAGLLSDGASFVCFWGIIVLDSLQFTLTALLSTGGIDVWSAVSPPETFAIATYELMYRYHQTGKNTHLAAILKTVVSVIPLRSVGLVYSPL